MTPNDSTARVYDAGNEEQLFLEHFRDPQVRADLEAGWTEYQAGARGYTSEEVLAHVKKELDRWEKENMR